MAELPEHKIIILPTGDNSGDKVIAFDLGDRKIEGIGRIWNDHKKAEINATKLMHCHNTHDNLLDACQAELVAINELLNTVNPVLVLAGLKPIPTPPLNGIRAVIKNAGGIVYETAKDVIIARAEK